MSVFLDVLTRMNPLFQAATLVALIAYVWKTWQMASATAAAAGASDKSLKEMQRTREQQIKPYVICYFQDIAASKFYELVIRNSGSTMAFDVDLVFEPPVGNYSGTQSIPTMSSKTFKALAPGYEWRTFRGSFIGMDESSVPKEIVAHVTFRWGAERILESYDVSFDLLSLKGRVFLARKPIENSLEEIASKLGELAAEVARHSENTNN